ncbi:hypothetical protein AAHC03_019229 [Spirometra sp. Aus1]
MFTVETEAVVSSLPPAGEFANLFETTPTTGQAQLLELLSSLIRYTGTPGPSSALKHLIPAAVVSTPLSVTLATRTPEQKSQPVRDQTESERPLADDQDLAACVGRKSPEVRVTRSKSNRTKRDVVKKADQKSLQGFEEVTDLVQAFSVSPMSVHEVTEEALVNQLTAILDSQEGVGTSTKVTMKQKLKATGSQRKRGHSRTQAGTSTGINEPSEELPKVTISPISPAKEAVSEVDEAVPSAVKISKNTVEEVEITEEESRKTDPPSPCGQDIFELSLTPDQPSLDGKTSPVVLDQPVAVFPNAVSVPVDMDVSTATPLQREIKEDSQEYAIFGSPTPSAPDTAPRAKLTGRSPPSFMTAVEGDESVSRSLVTLDSSRAPDSDAAKPIPSPLSLSGFRNVEKAICEKGAVGAVKRLCNTTTTYLEDKSPTCSQSQDANSQRGAILVPLLGKFVDLKRKLPSTHKSKVDPLPPTEPPIAKIASPTTADVTTIVHPLPPVEPTEPLPTAPPSRKKRQTSRGTGRRFFASSFAERCKRDEIRFLQACKATKPSSKTNNEPGSAAGTRKASRRSGKQAELDETTLSQLSYLEDKNSPYRPPRSRPQPSGITGSCTLKSRPAIRKAAAIARSRMAVDSDEDTDQSFSIVDSDDDQITSRPRLTKPSVAGQTRTTSARDEISNEEADFLIPSSNVLTTAHQEAEDCPLPISPMSSLEAPMLFDRSPLSLFNFTASFDDEHEKEGHQKPTKRTRARKRAVCPQGEAVGFRWTSAARCCEAVADQYRGHREMEVFDLHSSGSEPPLSFINQLVYEAVQKRHKGLLLGLRRPNSTALILAVCVHQTDHPVVTAIDAFLPMNAPQPASSVAWTALDLVRVPQTLVSQSEDIKAAVVAHLASRASPLGDCDTGQVVECDAPMTTAKFTLQLVFFDADSRPLFVTATPGILSVDAFDEIMRARRRGSALLTPAVAASTQWDDWRPAAFGADSPDWQDAAPSDSEEPWW